MLQAKKYKAILMQLLALKFSFITAVLMSELNRDKQGDSAKAKIQ